MKVSRVQIALLGLVVALACGGTWLFTMIREAQVSAQRMSDL